MSRNPSEYHTILSSVPAIFDLVLSLQETFLVKLHFLLVLTQEKSKLWELAAKDNHPLAGAIRLNYLFKDSQVVKLIISYTCCTSASHYL